MKRRIVCIAPVMCVIIQIVLAGFLANTAYGMGEVLNTAAAATTIRITGAHANAKRFVAYRIGMYGHVDTAANGKATSIELQTVESSEVSGKTFQQALAQTIMGIEQSHNPNSLAVVENGHIGGADPLQWIAEHWRPFTIDYTSEAWTGNETGTYDSMRTLGNWMYRQLVTEGNAYHLQHWTSSGSGEDAILDVPAGMYAIMEQRDATADSNVTAGGVLSRAMLVSTKIPVAGGLSDIYDSSGSNVVQQLGEVHVKADDIVLDASVSNSLVESEGSFTRHMALQIPAFYATLDDTSALTWTIIDEHTQGIDDVTPEQLSIAIADTAIPYSVDCVTDDSQGVTIAPCFSYQRKDEAWQPQTQPLALTELSLKQPTLKNARHRIVQADSEVAVQESAAAIMSYWSVSIPGSVLKQYAGEVMSFDCEQQLNGTLTADASSSTSLLSQSASKDWFVTSLQYSDNPYESNSTATVRLHDKEFRTFAVNLHIVDETTRIGLANTQFVVKTQGNDSQGNRCFVRKENTYTLSSASTCEKGTTQYLISNQDGFIRISGLRASLNYTFAEYKASEGYSEVNGQVIHFDVRMVPYFETDDAQDSIVEVSYQYNDMGADQSASQTLPRFLIPSQTEISLLTNAGFERRASFTHDVMVLNARSTRQALELGRLAQSGSFIGISVVLGLALLVLVGSVLMIVTTTRRARRQRSVQ
ncbi:SpaA isopeptide-forming pilin-related protein [Bifidobacterium aquikefiri]